jgi:hypothetical protein
MNIIDNAISGTTQEFTEIIDIRNDLVVMKDGSVSLVVRVAAVNFGLLSEREQEAIIYAYAGFLNSLNFAAQIIIRSQKKNISSYVAKLDAEKQKQKNSLLATQIENYKNFILQTVKENNVLDKKFYIVIPFSSLELGIKSSTKIPPVETIIEKANIALSPKRDHVLRQLVRLGLKAKQLTTAELIELFYEIYNPNKQRLEDTGKKFEQI